MKRETLTAMLGAIEESIEVPRRALRLIAKALGKPVAEPWDLMAGLPEALMGSGAQSLTSYKDGLAMVRESLGAIDSTMADFIDTMEKNHWIEGRSLPGKRQGAYCTRFPKSRSPRVYMTYQGSGADVRTLAHELGHAFHSWCMRDLPRPMHRYPATLGETASIFAETAVSDRLASLGDPRAEIESAWQNAKSAAGFLLNIPARFDFECAFYEKRQSTYVTARELGDLTDQAWRKWHGDSLAGSERQYWMTKLHFSMSSRRFYNFPYAFGYLFSLGIYALRAERGPGFMASYVDLLRDTGRMTVEDLAARHLGADLTQPDFWRKSLSFVRDQVDDLERLLSPMPRSARA